MSFLFFPGCKINSSLEEYGLATRSVLRHLGIDLVEAQLGCCGYPHRHLHFAAFLLLAARNMAIAEKLGLDLLTPCKCCFGSLRQAAHFLGKDEALARMVNADLEGEGLRWTGKARTRHLLTVLARDVGIEAIAARVTAPHRGLRVAAHYGCHALRPSDVMQFDNPLAPTIFERLVELTGAGSVDWPRRLDCCGRPLHESNRHVSLRLMRAKIEDALQAEADTLCTACSHCQLQFGELQESRSGSEELRSILYPQLLGLGLGLPPEDLGLGAAAG